MNSEELGFFNRQLAGMLKAGIPLEGGIRKLCETLPDSHTKQQLLALEKELANGTPLPEAVKKVSLPELYERMLTAGAKSGNLSDVLLLFADFCGRRHGLSLRLKGLLTYPLIVLSVALLVAVGLAVFLQDATSEGGRLIVNFTRSPASVTTAMRISLWVPTIIIAPIWLSALAFVFIPSARRRWQWRLPGLRETNLAQIAFLIEMQLRSGIDLPEALRTAEMLEEGSVIAADLAKWRTSIAEGRGNTPQVQGKRGGVPALFYWFITQSGEDVAGGFAQTAHYYSERSAYRNEMLLFAALPVTVLFLGFIVLGQFMPVFSALTRVMSALANPFDF